MPSPAVFCLPRLLRLLRPIGAAGGLAWLGGSALAQSVAPPPVGIYTCIDDKGRRLTADRPIAACVGKEQRLLNGDGSVRATLPPTLTTEERADKEARDREAALVRSALSDAARRDRNLMARFPNEAAHKKAREAALDTVRLAMKATEIRLRELAAERKPLKDEAEFYGRKIMPPKLRAALDANDASVEAQRASGANQEAELGRVSKIYDNEIERLRLLWAGAQAGSLGPMRAAPEPVRAPSGPIRAPSSPASSSSR